MGGEPRLGDETGTRMGPGGFAGRSPYSFGDWTRGREAFGPHGRRWRSGRAIPRGDRRHRPGRGRPSLWAGRAASDPEMKERRRVKLLADGDLAAGRAGPGRRVPGPSPVRGRRCGDRRRGGLASFGPGGTARALDRRGGGIAPAGALGGPTAAPARAVPGCRSPRSAGGRLAALVRRAWSSGGPARGPGGSLRAAPSVPPPHLKGMPGHRPGATVAPARRDARRISAERWGRAWIRKFSKSWSGCWSGS
jgi:hypothetical protein